MEDLVEREVRSTHAFFRDWFGGVCPRSEAHLATHFVGRLDPGFRLIDPLGDVIDLERFGRELWAGYGSGHNFALVADNIRCRVGDGEIILATYHEWQINAVRASRSHNGRVVTALFRVDDAAEHGLRWVHVHETWLPEPVVTEHFER